MKLHSGMILASSILLTACGGGGGGGGGGDTAQKQVTPPSNSEALTISAKPSQLDFEWAAVEVDAGDDVCYQLSVNPDGVSGYTLLKVADDGDELTDSDEEYCTTETNFSLENSTINTQWTKASYMLFSCINGVTECQQVTTQALTNDQMKSSIATILNPYWQDIVDSGKIFWGSQYAGGVAISADGNTIAIGSSHDSSYSSTINAGHTDILKNVADGSVDKLDYGAVYVFKKTNNQWLFDAYLKASTNRAPSDVNDPSTYTDCKCGIRSTFGATVDISDDGNTIAVGAPTRSYDSAPKRSGSIYVYTRNNDTWKEQQIITSSSPVEDGRLGEKLQIDGKGENIFSHGMTSGGQLLGEHFTLKNDIWEFKSTVPFPGTSLRGLSVSQDGNTISYYLSSVAGVAEYIDDHWELETITPPEEFSSFGSSKISGDGNTVAITGFETGTTPEVDIYNRNNGEWVHTETIQSIFPINQHAFGALKVNHSGNRVYTAHAIEYAFTVDEGIYPAEEFLSSVYLQPGKIKASKVGSIIIHISDKVNGQWIETNVIYHDLEGTIPQSEIYQITDGDLIFVDSMYTPEGTPLDIIKIY